MLESIILSALTEIDQRMYVEPNEGQSHDKRIRIRIRAPMLQSQLMCQWQILLNTVTYDD